MILWASFISFSGSLDFKLAVLFFIRCVRVRIYGIIFSGWSSNSKYATLGRLRAIAQTISYEIVVAFIFFTVLLLVKRIKVGRFVFFSGYFWILHNFF